MMISEFIERTGFEPTADEYAKIEEMASLKAATTKPRCSRELALVCVTSEILETEFFIVIHKNRAGVLNPDTIHDFSYFASTPTIDIEPQKQAMKMPGGLCPPGK